MKLRVTQKEYEQILHKLNMPEDVEKVYNEHGLAKEALWHILAQKMVRQTLRTFHQVKARSGELKQRWEHGMTMLEISKMCSLAPTLCASFILAEKGFSKVRFRELVRNVPAIKDERIRKELAEALEADFVYSEKAHIEQKARGIAHEKKIEHWLRENGFQFWTEQDRAGAEKTPDFLLKKTVVIEGKEIHWFESKAYFADGVEIKKSYNKQFKHYVELFGPGIVVYWWGFVEDAVLPPEIKRHIIFVDGSFFEKAHNMPAQPAPHQ